MAEDSQQHPDEFGFHDVFIKHLVCPSCNKKLKNPKTLSCLHSFCNECLRNSYQQQQRQQVELDNVDVNDVASNASEQQDDNDDDNEEDQLVESDFQDCQTTIPSDTISDRWSRGHHSNMFRNYFSCPLDDCDTITRVSLDKDVEELSIIEINAPLSNIERTLTLKEDIPKGCVLCEGCELETAIGVCYNKKCNNRPFCGSCLEVHLRENRTEKHCIAYPNPPCCSLEGGNEEDVKQNDLKDWKDLKQGEIFCTDKDHEDCIRNIYCAVHDKVICLRCTALHTHHADCKDRYATDDIYPECCDQTKRLLEQVVGIHGHFKGATATTAAIQKALVMKSENVKESINNRYEDLKMQLQNQRDDLLRNTGRILELKSNELNEHLKMLDQVSAKLAESIDFVTDFIGTAIPSDFMMMKTQINNRLDELLVRYSNYHFTPLENDCIYLKENKHFDMANAIGCVFSTPSSKRFHIRQLTTSPIENQPSYFVVAARDILRTNLSLGAQRPELRVTIRPVGEEEWLHGYITFDRGIGKYVVMVNPNRSGVHEVSIFEPLGPPYDRWLCGGRMIKLNVNSANPLQFFMSFAP